MPEQDKHLEPHTTGEALPPLPDISTVAAMLEFTAAMTREIYELDTTGTSPTMLVIAPLIGEMTLKGETITFQSLQQRSGLPKSTLSRTISALVKDQWIMETVDPEDRRKRVLIPSTRTFELSAKILSITDSVLTSHFGDDILMNLRDRAIAQGAPKFG